MNDPVVVVLIVIAAVALSVRLGFMIGRKRGRGEDGAGLGLLGPIGWLMAVYLEDHRARCPHCLSTMHALANVCRECGREVTRKLTFAEIQERMRIERELAGANSEKPAPTKPTVSSPASFAQALEDLHAADRAR